MNSHDKLLYRLDVLTAIQIAKHGEPDPRMQRDINLCNRALVYARKHPRRLT